jgi:hypothetical protein
MGRGKGKGHGKCRSPKGWVRVKVVVSVAQQRKEAILKEILERWGWEVLEEIALEGILIL